MTKRRPRLPLVASMVAVLAALASGGCAPPAGDTASSRTIRIGHSGAADFGDLPGLLAHERLRAEGFVVEETHFNGTDLAIQALASGQADFGNGSITGAWTAIARGAPLLTVMEHTVNPHRLVAGPGISTCADLDGRPLGLHNEAGVGTDLVRLYLAEECPRARPEMLYIEGSPNRAAALLAGRLDATPLDLASLHWLEGQAPGRFRVLSDFAERWPAIKTTGVQVNANFAAARPDLVHAYLRARLLANRELGSSPERLVAEAERLLGPSPHWPSVARSYVAAGAWSPDGGMTDADVARTLGFFGGTGSLAAMPADRVADLGFLRDALLSLAPARGVRLPNEPNASAHGVADVR